MLKIVSKRLYISFEVSEKSYKHEAILQMFSLSIACIYFFSTSFVSSDKKRKRKTNKNKTLYNMMAREKHFLDSVDSLKCHFSLFLPSFLFLSFFPSFFLSFFLSSFLFFLSFFSLPSLLFFLKTMQECEQEEKHRCYLKL